MAIQSGFFQSNGGDRIYRSDLFASYFGSFIGNGVFPNPSSGLQVTTGNGLSVNVPDGKGWINGYYLTNVGAINLVLGQADGILSRIDRVVMGLNFNTRLIDIYIKPGVPSGNPVAPTLTRDTSIHELGLADVRVNAGATAIQQVNITDTRLNTQLCGIVAAVVQQLDTTTLFNQYQQSILDTINNNQQQFDQFLADVNAQLGGDVAGNLLNQINQLRSDFNTHVGLRNPHGTTKADVSLGNVQNYNIATEAQAQQGTSNDSYMTPLRTAAAIDAKAGLRSNLQTTAKGTLVDAINETFTQAVNGKVSISNAINGKGGTTSSSDTFQQLANAITAINQGRRSSSGVVSGLPTTDVTVRGLDFRPSIIILRNTNSTSVIGFFSLYLSRNVLNTNADINMNTNGATNTNLTASTVIYDDGFNIRANSTNDSYSWIAFE